MIGSASMDMGWVEVNSSGTVGMLIRPLLAAAAVTAASVALRRRAATKPRVATEAAPSAPDTASVAVIVGPFDPVSCRVVQVHPNCPQL